MIRKHIATLLALGSTIPFAFANASPGGSQLLFEDKLDIRQIDELRATPIADRAARLQSFGLSRDDWYAHFEKAAAEFVSLAGTESPPPAKALLDLRGGLMLVSLLRDKGATGTLEGIVGAPGAMWGESFVYLALIGMNELRTDDAFVTACLDHRDPRLGRLAILASSLRSDGFIVAELERVRTARGGEAPISEAFQFVSLLRHDQGAYGDQETLAAKIDFIASRVGQGFDMVDGSTSHWDPYSAGSPLVRWALEEWSALSRESPDQVAAYIQNADSYPSAALNGRYQAYLARNASAAVQALLGVK